MVKPKNEGYLGNHLIKRSGIETEYTEHEMAEYLKCSENPTHFIENYTQIISLDEGLVLNFVVIKKNLLTTLKTIDSV